MRAVDILSKTCRFNGERYEVGLLWKEDLPTLPNNKSMASRRFVALESRFAREPAVGERYAAVMNE